MELDAFDFSLPEELIALRPIRPRPRSRLLVADHAGITDDHVCALERYLRPGDLLVLNNTRVLAARLFGKRVRQPNSPNIDATVAQVETTLLRRESGHIWQAMARPAKRLAPGDTIIFGDLEARVIARDGAVVRLEFAVSGAALDTAIASCGEMPLPPYIARRRAADARDREDYQSVFATSPGAVAAPTASLHFDKALLARLAAYGVQTAYLTLHVGAGTFLPVTANDITQHVMHSEWGEIPADTAATINRVRAAGGRVIPVGTTALRLIESAASPEGRLSPWQGETDIFIRPGYRFRVTDGLMTNFHLPKSTLFMLVSALMGCARMHQIYRHAIAQRYRFYSYGDSSLLLPH